MGQEVYLARGSDVDNGQVTVYFQDLYPGVAERPTDAPVGRDTPHDVLNLLVIGSQRFIPVYPGMWLGINPQYNNRGGS